MAAFDTGISSHYHYVFTLDYFPYGNSSFTFNGEPISSDFLVLLCDEFKDGFVNGSFVCGYLTLKDGAYSFDGLSQSDGDFAYGVKHYPSLSLDKKNSFEFYFTPNSLYFTSSFVVSPSAMEFCLAKGGFLFDSAGEPFYASLNGKYGSFPDDTVVTVDGKEGQFVVKASELFWNDKDTNSYMMTYILSQSGTNKFLMSPDIYVKKVV
ncbi:MAG: hypothetical protein LRY68_03240 [Sulfurospirillum sp.]|nr:hypothetical protein [Sulfurospirillum sp.]